MYSKESLCNVLSNFNKSAQLADLSDHNAWVQSSFRDSKFHTFRRSSQGQGEGKVEGSERVFVMIALRPAGSDPEVVCQKNSFLKVSVSLGGFDPSVAHGKHCVRRRCVQATKNKAET